MSVLKVQESRIIDGVSEVEFNVESEHFKQSFLFCVSIIDTLGEPDKKLHCRVYAVDDINKDNLIWKGHTVCFDADESNLVINQITDEEDHECRFLITTAEDHNTTGHILTVHSNEEGIMVDLYEANMEDAGYQDAESVGYIWYSDFTDTKE